eukprot:773266_1
MSIIWLCLAGMRFWFIFSISQDNSPLYQPPASSITRRRLYTNNNNNINNIYCPPDFFSCKIQYNSSCIAEISTSKNNNKVIDFMCNDDNTYRRKLQDSNFDSMA